MQKLLECSCVIPKSLKEWRPSGLSSTLELRSEIEEKPVVYQPPRRSRSANASQESRKRPKDSLCKLSIPPSPSLLLTSARYAGYNQEMIDGFVNMGFDLDRVVAAFDFVGIDPNGGELYELEEAYIGDITARLLGEP